VILTDLPSPAEASAHPAEPVQGFAQAGNRFPLFGITHYVARQISLAHMSVSSPCTKVCTMDPRTGLCRGCGRTLDEIAGWGSLSEPQRLRIMAQLPQRLETGARTRVEH
jgi:predicted Fe-S protein YdhL (DUF1289 family)